MATKRKKANKMEVIIEEDGSMIITDSTDDLHIFCPNESKQIRTEVYRWCQKQKKMKN